MTLSPDDLKQLKGKEMPCPHCGQDLRLPADIKPFLARLEAAELCAEHSKLLSAYLSKKNPDAFERGTIEVCERRVKAWRTAAGK